MQICVLFIDNLKSGTLLIRSAFISIFMIHTIDYGINVPSRRSLSREIRNMFLTNIVEIQNNLKEAKFVCTTADVWSGRRRSFLGVTAHWIEENTFKRKSVALACRRFAGNNFVIAEWVI